MENKHDKIANAITKQLIKKKMLSKANLRINLFIYYFIETRNANKAAILAGYAKGSARQAGYRILKRINERGEVIHKKMILPC